MAIYEKESMTKSVVQTISDLKGVQFVLTRFNPKVLLPDDLDILVRSEDFEKCILILNNLGYQSSSHDKALGGRVPGMQVNLVKSQRIKIDLHKNFTWRKKYYLNIEKIWASSIDNHVDPIWDAFLVVINILFEKTYIMPSEFDLLSSKWSDIVSSLEFTEQATKYGWAKSFALFKEWMSQHLSNRRFPLFLPIKLVLVSFIEKPDLVSFAYYCFFRIRYSINAQLPYETI